MCYTLGMATRSKTKSAKQLERHFKGIANHRRIEILFLIAENDQAAGRFRWHHA